MLDHVSIQVDDLPASTAFYDAVLAPLGFRRVMESPGGIAYGQDHPSFWVGPTYAPGPGRELHLAFVAPDRAAVRAFQRPRRRPAPRCCTRRACGRSTTRPTTARSCATRTATTSRRSATDRVEPSPTSHDDRAEQTGSLVGGAWAASHDERQRGSSWPCRQQGRTGAGATESSTKPLPASRRSQSDRVRSRPPSSTSMCRSSNAAGSAPASSSSTCSTISRRA